jgi:tetratricopeptide (TPR) repeat protein
MSANNYSNFGFEYYEKGRSLIEDRFVGRKDALALFSEIIEYPLRGKEMPVLQVRGISGSGKSWLLGKFAGILEARRAPYVSFNLRSPISGNLPGAWVRLVEEISHKYNIKTPRFNRISAITDRRFRGIVKQETPDSTGFFKGLFQQIAGGQQQEELVSPKMFRETGKDWEQTLTSRPLNEHLRAMSIALAEDIDYELDRKKFPFMTLILDSWNIATNRQAPLWKALAENCSRLLLIVATQTDVDFSDKREILLYDFDERETREALERRAIASPQAVANILERTGGSPLAVSMAASLAELITRTGDIIRADTFTSRADEQITESYSTKIWDLLRDSERYALCAAAKSPGLPPELFAELHAQRADLPAGVMSVMEFVPFDPPFSAESPVKIHSDIFDTVEELTHGAQQPNIADLSRRAERLLENENLLEWEVLNRRLDLRLEPDVALSSIIERIMALRASGDFTAAESLWRCSHPEGNLGLAAIHRLVGFDLLKDYLSLPSLKKYFGQESESVITDAEFSIEHARIIASEEADTALRELQDCVSSLSSAITETSGKEPALWFLRGRALLLASEIMFDGNIFREVVSSAQKAYESFERAIEADLNTAGLVSLSCAKAALATARAINALADTKSAMAWMTKGLERLEEASQKRNLFTADISLTRAEILSRQGELFLKKEKYGEAEECFNSALEELGKIAGEYRLYDAISTQRKGVVYIALARLLQRTGSQELAFRALEDARNSFEIYRSAIGGEDGLLLLGYGNIFKVEAEMNAADDSDRALKKLRKAIEYFERAWGASETLEAAEGQIDSLLFEADLLAEDNKNCEPVFERIESILSTRFSGRATKISAIFKGIALAKTRGRAAFLRGDNNEAARFFADAIHGYSELNEISSELPNVADLADIHLAAAIAHRSGGEPAEAFRSLRRSLDAFELAADKFTERGRKQVLNAVIGVYNELSAVGLDEECFEAAIFILGLAVQVGGQEAISTGHDLVEYWMAQDLSFRDKRRLEEVASTLQEYWGE